VRGGKRGKGAFEKKAHISYRLRNVPSDERGGGIQGSSEEREKFSSYLPKKQQTTTY